MVSSAKRFKMCGNGWDDERLTCHMITSNAIHVAHIAHNRYRRSNVLVCVCFCVFVWIVLNCGCVNHHYCMHVACTLKRGIVEKWWW